MERQQKNRIYLPFHSLAQKPCGYWFWCEVELLHSHRDFPCNLPRVTDMMRKRKQSVNAVGVKTGVKLTDNG